METQKTRQNPLAIGYIRRSSCNAADSIERQRKAIFARATDRYDLHSVVVESEEQVGESSEQVGD